MRIFGLRVGRYRLLAAVLSVLVLGVYVVLERIAGPGWASTLILVLVLLTAGIAVRVHLVQLRTERLVMEAFRANRRREREMWGSVQDGLERLEQRVVEFTTEATRIEREREDSVERRGRDERKRLRRMVRRDLLQQYRQFESLAALYYEIEPEAPFPPTRGWPASPDVLFALHRLVLDEQPEVVLECGSGVSTIVIGYALRRLGRGRVIALEHLEEYRDRTMEEVDRHGLGGFVEVRFAPLTEVTVSGHQHRWYDLSVLPQQMLGLVFVDGPPRRTQQHARYPAVPALRHLLAPGCVIVLDDLHREDERAVVDRWMAEFPELELRTEEHEKGTAVLRLALKDGTT